MSLPLRPLPKPDGSDWFQRDDQATSRMSDSLPATAQPGTRKVARLLEE